MEIATSALAFFMDTKARLYARHGVPEYWIIDLQGRAIHQMWAPGADGYGERREVAIGEPVEAVGVPGLRIDTAELV